MLLFVLSDSNIFQDINNYDNKYINTESVNLIWKDDKLTEMNWRNRVKKEFTYSNQTCKGFFPLLGWEVNEEFGIIFAYPELFGIRTTKLLTKIVFINNDGTTYTEEYTYQLDKDGYIEKCNIKTTEFEDNSTSIWTFKWE